jgi:hypothetical protein
VIALERTRFDDPDTGLAQLVSIVCLPEEVGEELVEMVRELAGVRDVEPVVEFRKRERSVCMP